MKHLILFFLLLGVVPAFAQQIPPKPNPPRLVNDFAHVLSDDQIAALERKLVAYDDSTSTQILVVTIESRGDYGIEDYGLKFLREWGVGNKKTNNGIVIIAAIKNHEVRIETGYGLEGAIPDITAEQIINNQILPNFKEGNYYQGFDAAADQLIKAAAGEYKAPANYHPAKREGKGGSIIPFIVVIIIIIVISRGGGRGGGGMMSRRGYNPFWGGFLGGMLGSGMGRSGGGWSGGGGGGGWSGGGGGGGGFGGFGGGSGGGGGASGSW